MDELTLRPPVPTAARPLLGLTILVVEDSRFASEALRLLCLRSGARIRRADCLASAGKHLSTYRPTVAIVDLGLPDGSGLDLVRTLAAAPEGPEAILATSGVDRAEAEAQALDAGAHAFLPKPVEGLAAFQQTILSLLPPERRPKGVRPVTAETVAPDRLALAEDLSEAERMLDADAEPVFVAGFLQGLAQTGRDPQMREAARALRADPQDIRPRLRALIASRREDRHVV